MNFLGEPYFLFLVIPLITVFFSVFLKIVTRNDKFVAFKKEDLAIGLEMSVSALIIFISHTAEKARVFAEAQAQAKAIPGSATPIQPPGMEAVPWLILLLCVMIWSVSTVVRKFGWQEEEQLHIWWGIVLPDVFGFVALIFVLNWIS